MKKTVSMLIVLIMAFAVFHAAAEDPAGNGDTSLVVGNTTPMRGDFFTDMWGNATSDIDVRDLLHACNLVCWDGVNGSFTIDSSVVSGAAASENEAGDHTYILVLCDDLFFSDGTRITAWDYAFSYLLSASPELAEIGAVPLRSAHIKGYREYAEQGGTLSGIRVLSDDTLSVTLDHAYLPFFYELGLLSCNPYPISVIAPGVIVRDDGNGVYLANKDPEEPEPLFTADLLRSTVMDPDTGYRSHPSVVSGPYMLTSWDGVTAEFDVNPCYKGNNRGEKPAIAHLVYTLASGDTMVQDLAEGRVDLLNKITRADTVREGIALKAEDRCAMSNYPRTGLSYISFACERPTVSGQAVRQAIAYCFDRDRTVSDYVGPFGLRVDGYFGIGQWMYCVLTGLMPPPPFTDGNGTQAQAEYEAEIALLNLDGLNPYAFSISKAAKLLDDDGWTINADGLREKDGVVLKLRLICPEGNPVIGSLEANLAANLSAVGIDLTIEPVPMDELLSRWYKREGRQEDMYYLASDFDQIFDPSEHFNADGAWSWTNLADEVLYNAAAAMRTTKPGDVINYLKHWIAFEERFNETLPMIPVYSNVYFDFYRNDLQMYRINESVTWSQAIVGAWLGNEEND